MDGKFRILALHGGVSNSNILRFQASRLRKLLGPSAEWTVPDAPGRWDPLLIEDVHPDSVYAAYSAERSSVEKILAKGAPFCEWFAFGLDQRPVRGSYDEGWRWLLEYVRRNGPFHLVIAFGQSTQVANRVAEELRRLGEGHRLWRLNLFFNADPPLPWETEEALYGEEGLPQSTLLVHSAADTTHTCEEWLPFYRRTFKDFLLCEHDEGRAWPMKEPRASQIYAEVVEWLRSQVGEETPLVRELPAASAVATDWQPRPAPGPRRTGAAEDRPAASEARTASSAGRAQERAIRPDELAELLLARQCVVADTRDVVAGRVPFPGACKQDVSWRTLEMGPPSVWRQRVDYLRADGRRLVAVSEDGGPCREYCELLVERLGFPAERVCRLRGGVSRWRAWEAAEPRLRGEIGSMYGLPLRRSGGSLPVEAIEPEELARMLRSSTCQVLDTRELAESRGRAFPGAHKNVSFLTLRRCWCQCGRSAARRTPSAVLEKLRKMADSVTTRLVAVSATGLRCEAYCRLLLEKLGPGREQGGADEDQWLRSSLCRLAGGLLAWDSWAHENCEVAEELRLQYGLPTAARGRALVPCSDMGAAAREHSLEVLQ